MIKNRMNAWVRIPTGWILDKEKYPLRDYTWSDRDNKSNYIAALMLYICIAQQIDSADWIQLSYKDFCTITSLSRAKVSSGLHILSEKNLIKIATDYKTHKYKILGYKEEGGGWAKLPSKYLYDYKEEQIKPFMSFKLRQRVEIDSLKLFLLLIALRDNQKNHATPSYETIYKYTGIQEKNIRSAISFLVSLDMIHVQKYGNTEELNKRNNFYRIIGIDGNRHAGNMSYDKLFKINN